MSDLPSLPEIVTARTRGIVFDLDGTLVDSYRAIVESLNHARSTFGLPPAADDDVRRHVGHGLESLIADLIRPDVVAEGVARFRERYAEVFARWTHALPGVTDGLARLRECGFRMSVATNKPARFAVPILRELELLSLFDVVEGPDTAGAAKPDPAMIRRCLRAMQVGEEAGLYVGDMELDAESGRRAHVPVVLVVGGSATVQRLRATGCPVMENFTDLVDRLAGRSGGVPSGGRPGAA